MLTRLLTFAAISLAIYLGVAIILVLSQSPSIAPAADDESLDFTDTLTTDYTDLPPLTPFTTRDNTALGMRVYESSTATKTIIILVHGSAWHGMQFHDMAKYLAQNGLGTVIVPDLRGHGPNPIRRGDVDHIGQLEEDLADLITHFAPDPEQANIVLGGHSSGGGLVVRFAGGAYGHLADSFILMAPFLKHDAPTTKPNAGGWAAPSIRRIIGLSMLNNVGIKIFNHLPMITFAMPKLVLDGPLGDTATLQYSYRLNTSFAPRDKFEDDLKKLQQPFLLLVGADDESFYADKYQPTIAPHTQSGTYEILPDTNHLGIVTAPDAFVAIRNWLAKLANK